MQGVVAGSYLSPMVWWRGVLFCTNLLGITGQENQEGEKLCPLDSISIKSVHVFERERDIYI
jgi:hypothetical protein